VNCLAFSTINHLQAKKKDMDHSHLKGGSMQRGVIMVDVRGGKGGGTTGGGWFSFSSSFFLFLSFS
jgi:hypothetical protein